MEALEEIFLATEVNLTVESRTKVKPRSAKEIYVIALELKPNAIGKKLSWPNMDENQAVVFENLKRIL